jgi:anti-sigma factor RsiW
MVTGIHPDEIDLFDYVEGDLPADRAALLEVHLASCARCADQVARVTAGREALRESQFLQLPPRRRESIFLNLPEQRRKRPGSPMGSPKRILAILTPLAAVAAVIAVLANTNGGTGNEQAGGAAATAGALTSKTATDQTGSEGGGAEALAPFRTVQGPADAVAAELRAKGIDARVVGQRVEVRQARRAKVDRALGKRRPGGVEIVLVP